MIQKPQYQWSAMYGTNHADDMRRQDVQDQELRRQALETTDPAPVPKPVPKKK